LQSIRNMMDKEGNYLKVIQYLEPGAQAAGTAWLQGIVDTVVARVMACIPSCKE